jgi:serine/threonine protein kinase
MELASGNLLSLLRNPAEQLSKTALLRMALSCAAGMTYLADCKITHRDLAARNLLYFSEGESLTVKVADFGLASGIKPTAAQSNPLIPVRWSALESLLRREFNEATDVWSYGVVLYELFSGGADPYGSMPTSELASFLKAGKRLECPKDCPAEVYLLMLSCWDADPAKRPRFLGLCETITGMLGTSFKTAPSIRALSKAIGYGSGSGSEPGSGSAIDAWSSETSSSETSGTTYYSVFQFSKLEKSS